jgi:hypothetical protein
MIYGKQVKLSIFIVFNFYLTVQKASFLWTYFLGSHFEFSSHKRNAKFEADESQ